MLTYLTTILVIQELWCGFSMVFGAPYPQIANTTCPLPPIAKQIIAWYLKPFPTVIRRSKGKEEMRRKREHVPLQVPVISWQEMIKCWPYITVGGGRSWGIGGKGDILPNHRTVPDLCRWGWWNNKAFPVCGFHYLSFVFPPSHYGKRTEVPIFSQSSCPPPPRITAA